MKKDMAYWNSMGMRDGYMGNYSPPQGPFESVLDLGAWNSGYKEGRAQRIADDSHPGTIQALRTELDAVKKRLDALGI